MKVGDEGLALRDEGSGFRDEGQFGDLLASHRHCSNGSSGHSTETSEPWIYTP